MPSACVKRERNGQRSVWQGVNDSGRAEGWSFTHRGEGRAVPRSFSPTDRPHRGDSPRAQQLGSSPAPELETTAALLVYHQQQSKSARDFLARSKAKWEELGWPGRHTGVQRGREGGSCPHSTLHNISSRSDPALWPHTARCSLFLAASLRQS